MFYIETISNPLLEIADIPAVAAFCQENRLTSIIDNTFASPAVIRQATTCCTAHPLHSSLASGNCAEEEKVLCGVAVVAATLAVCVVDLAVVCRPAELGIDVIVESATKYLNGHADVIAGVVAGNTEFMHKVGHTSIVHVSWYAGTSSCCTCVKVCTISPVV